MLCMYATPTTDENLVHFQLTVFDLQPKMLKNN